MTPRGETATRERAAAILGIARSTLDDWVARGCPVWKPSPRKGVAAEFHMPDVIEWRVNQAVMATEPDNLDGARERARLFRAQADRAELDLAVARNEYVRADEMLTAQIAVFASIRDRILAVQSVVPLLHQAALTGGQAAMRPILVKALRDALEELGNAEIVPVTPASETAEKSRLHR